MASQHFQLIVRTIVEKHISSGTPRWQSWLKAFRSLLPVFVITVPIYVVGIAMLDRLLSPRGVTPGIGVLATVSLVFAFASFTMRNDGRIFLACK
jgi:hypothetical protein